MIQNVDPLGSTATIHREGNAHARSALGEYRDEQKEVADNFSAKTVCRERLAGFDVIEKKVRACPAIDSTKTVQNAQVQITLENTSTVADIAEVIAKDADLTARLLHIINSVCGGLVPEVTRIEEAIFFLGLRKIRQMAMTIHILEQMEAFTHDGFDVFTAEHWRHSIAMALMSSEVLTVTHGLQRMITPISPGFSQM